ncbi:MAG: GIY-YIG nuclease family protein [Cyanobacteria bacterium J069]|nr:MAG: GIY-YIG nuclease family protein [Cyanobacteria bacterium J069]
MPTLAELPFFPYLDDQGDIIHEFDGKVGAYAIFDADQTLQYIGYSRDVTASLLQHLVRVPQGCYWVKVSVCDRPSRTLLETIRTDWIAESGITPPGNGDDEALWNQPIDAKVHMTSQEQAAYANADDQGKIKTLKQVARRIEAEVLQTLGDRGVTTPIRFDPKLKEEGLLGLKPV